MNTGIQARLEAIYICEKAGDSLRSVSSVMALAGQGLEGDRYCRGRGTWSHWPGDGRQLTLVEASVAARIERDFGVLAASLRRNLVVAGVSLNELVGGAFSIGEVQLRGVRLCDPCAYLEKITVPGVAEALAQRGGLRADILVGGKLKVGDQLSGC